MNEYNNIPENEDLSQIAPHLAKIGRANSYTVPDGYFDSLQESIQDLIMLDSIGLQKEKQVFEVPVGYFEQLTQDIETKIRTQQFPKAANDFAVPESYFDNLADEINTRIALERIESIAPKTNSFQVPSMYFDELANNIQAKTQSQNKQGGTVISLFADRFTVVAVAASITVILSIGILMKLTNGTSNNLNVNKDQVATTTLSITNTVPVIEPKQAIEAEAEPNTIETAVVSHIDEQTIVDAIPENALASNVNADDLSEEDINNFTSEDIGDYLFNESGVASPANGI